MIKNSFEFQVLVNGKPVKEYAGPEAALKTYIEGKKGTQYSLRLRNNTPKRALFIPSVDGLNVITGKRATEKDTGYIVDGYDAVTIDGWRISNQAIAQFFFSGIEQSYAEKKGKGQNVGVIGCAVVKEKVKPAPIIKYVYDTIVVHDHHPHCNCTRCSPSIYYGASWSSMSNGLSGGGGYLANNVTSLSSAQASSESVQNNFRSQEIGTGWTKSL